MRTLNSSPALPRTLSLMLGVVVSLGFVAGCSSSKDRNHRPPSPLEIQVSDVPRAKMDPDVARSSDAMHSFLVGQLAYSKEDLGLAQKNFLRAGELAWLPVPKIHATLAELFLKDGKLLEALKEADKALQNNPNETNLMLIKAGVQEALGRSEDALATFAAIIRIDKQIVDAPFLSAVIYGRQKQLDKGISILDQYFKANPQSILVPQLLGLLHEEAGNFEEADRLFQGLAKKNPENLSSLFDRIRVLLRSGKRDRAVSLAKQMLAKRQSQSVVAAEILRAIVAGGYPPNELLKTVELLAPAGLNPQELRLKLALFHVQEQKFGDALRELSIVLNINPNYSVARYYRASIFGGAGRKGEAYQDLLAIKPGQELFVRSRTFAAFLLKQEKDFDGAEKMVREALAVEPDNKSVFSYLILILRDSKRYDDAIKLLDEALQREPNSERVLFNQGIIFNDLGRMGEAVRVMERVIDLNPNHSDALNFVAYALAEEGRELGRAEELANRALLIAPKDGFYLDTLGWIYYQREEYGRAVQTLGRAVQLTGGDVVVTEHYGDALMKALDFEQAAAVYRAALEKGRDQEIADRTPDVEAAISRLDEKLELLSKRHPEVGAAPYVAP